MICLLPELSVRNGFSVVYYFLSIFKMPVMLNSQEETDFLMSRAKRTGFFLPSETASSYLKDCRILNIHSYEGENTAIRPIGYIGQKASYEKRLRRLVIAGTYDCLRSIKNLTRFKPSESGLQICGDIFNKVAGISCFNDLCGKSTNNVTGKMKYLMMCPE